MAATQILLLSLIITCGAFTIITRKKEQNRLNTFINPLTIFLIIILAFMQDPGSYSLYKSLVIGGLTFALFGNIFTVLKENRYLYRMSFLMMTVVVFTVTFSTDPGPYFGWVYSIPAALYLIIFGAIYLMRAGKISVAVSLYILLMSFFLFQASGRTWYLAEEGVSLAFFGVVLFISAETLYIFNRFVKPFKSARVLHLSFYWPALLFISLSI